MDFGFLPGEERDAGGAGLVPGDENAKVEENDVIEIETDEIEIDATGNSLKAQDAAAATDLRLAIRSPSPVHNEETAKRRPQWRANIGGMVYIHNFSNNARLTLHRQSNVVSSEFSRAIWDEISAARIHSARSSCRRTTRLISRSITVRTPVISSSKDQYYSLLFFTVKESKVLNYLKS